MMAIRAPWKGWIKVAMPVVSALILANTVAVFILSLLNSIALQISYDDPPEYVETHTMLIRAQLVFFWCTISAVFLIVTSSEIFSLWTDRLRPLWVLISSVGALCVWILQLVLWQLCVQPLGSSAPGYCPYVYRGDGWGRFPSWYNATSKAPAQTVPTLFVLYLAQLTFAAIVFHRQRRCAFRRSDMTQLWLRKLEDGDSEVTSEATLVGSPSAVTSSWPSSFHASEYREFLSAGPKRPPALPVPKSGSPVSLQASEFGDMRSIGSSPPQKMGDVRPGSPFSFHASSEEEESFFSVTALRPPPVTVPPIRAMRPMRSLEELGHRSH